MRPTFPDVVEKGRVAQGKYATPPGVRYGSFALKAPTGAFLRVIASDGVDWHAVGLTGPPWEHVSVSVVDRCPTWEEMAYVKGLFWRDEECVVQFHVPAADHVNRHEFTLHLWRPVDGTPFPRPPKECV